MQKYVRSCCISEWASFDNGSLKILLAAKMNHFILFKSSYFLIQAIWSPLLTGVSCIAHLINILNINMKTWKMLIGLAKYLSMDERWGYVSIEWLCMCVMCVCVFARVGWVLEPEASQSRKPWICKQCAPQFPINAFTPPTPCNQKEQEKERKDRRAITGISP